MSYTTVKQFKTNDDFIDLVIGGGCQSPKTGRPNYTGVTKTRCGDKCRDSAFECGSDICGSFNENSRESCQSNMKGLCRELTTLPDERRLVEETESRIAKTCKYNASICDTLDNYNQVRNFEELQQDGIVSPEDMDKCTSNFCSLPPTETCRTDPKTGKPFKSCSKYASAGTEGDICRTWLSEQSDNVKESTINNICTKDSSLGDCACVRRTDDKTYNAVVDGLLANPINDGCWWKTCRNTDIYLVPPSVNTDNCPLDFCQQIVNVVDTGRDVTIADLNTDINCNFAETPVPIEETPVPIEDDIVPIDDKYVMSLDVIILISMIGLLVLTLMLYILL